MRSLAVMAFALSGFWVSASSTYAQQSSDPCSAIVVRAKTLMQTDSNAARVVAHEAEQCALRTSRSSSRDRTFATAQWLQGEAYLRINDVEHATPLIDSAKFAVRSLGDGAGELAGEILLSSGGLHQAKGDTGLALSDYQRAYLTFEKFRYNRGRAMALVTIAGLYNDANDPVHSLKYLNEASDLFPSDKNLQVSIYNNIANNLQDMGRYSASEIEYRKALALAGRMGSALLRARIIANIAHVRLKAGQIAAANTAIDQGYQLTADGEAAVWRPQFIDLAAQLALQRRAYARAAALIEQRFAGVDLTTTTITLRSAHQTAYEAYRALGDDEDALVHLAALKRLDDKATALATSSNTALMAARFDFANQALRIAKLQAEDLRRRVAFQRARAKTQRTIFLGAVGGGAIVIGLLAFALVTSRRARRKVDAANTDLAVTNASLARALAAKTEFLATTSHEIRTPLNGILGMTQVMMADRQLSPPVQDRIGVIHAAGTAMRALVDDILDVAKMETGKLTLERTAFALPGMIADTARMWQEQARAKGIEFAVDLIDCPARIEGDPARVRQIVSNLLSNALKFTAEGSVRLRVATDGDERYVIAVSDSGIGIPAAKHDSIFESFSQADAGTTRRFGGTGLGLAICRNLAREMGGDIRLTSIEGKGSTFTVVLPLETAEVEAADAAPTSDGQPALLIVDRNPIMRSMFRTLLAPHVATVAFADSVGEAVAAVEAGTIAHILVDDATLRAAGDPVTAASGIAMAARSRGVAVTLLWPKADEAGGAALTATGITRLVAKPIGGAALANAMFGNNSMASTAPPLVSDAA